jgi:hypothetical protein
MCVTIDGVWIGDYLQGVNTNNCNTIVISTLYTLLEHTV